jgi:hypothetical protein
MMLYPLPDVAAKLHKSTRWLQGYLREQNSAQTSLMLYYR